MSEIHLHELIEVSKRNGGSCPYVSNSFKDFTKKNKSKADLGRFVAHSLLPNSICFHGGKYSVGEQLSPEMTLIRLPYPICWFEFTTEYENIIGILAQQNKKEVIFSIWERDKFKDWIFMGHFFANEENGEISSTKGGNDRENNLLYSYSLNALHFINFLNCKNVLRYEHKPSEKLNRARHKKGKQPLFSYWTLNLDIGAKNKLVSYGGSHASPRLHLRRGHPRQYSQGKWTWVQPCVVGSKENGMIHKDYAFEY